MAVPFSESGMGERPLSAKLFRMSSCRLVATSPLRGESFDRSYLCGGVGEWQNPSVSSLSIGRQITWRLWVGGPGLAFETWGSEGSRLLARLVEKSRIRNNDVVPFVVEDRMCSRDSS
jgi:hypothetical protein